MLLSISSIVGIAIDVIIVAVLLILGFIGFKKGFFKSVLSLFSTLVVIVISIFCASPLAKLINKIYDFTGLIAGKLSSAIAGMGAFYNYPIPEGMSGADVVSAIPSGTNGFLKKLMSYVLKPLSASDIQGATVADVVSGAFASIIMLIICAIVLFILIKIILSFASRLFENITRNRVFGATNKVAGFAFGAAKGLLIILVFTVVLTLLTVVPVVNKKISPVIQDDTKIARVIYNTTDKFIGKQVVEGQIVQKWIDNLWENKYKDKGNDQPEVEPANGTASRPYTVTLNNDEEIYSATLKLNFAMSNAVYYMVDATSVGHAPFAIYVEVDGVEMEVYSSDNLAAPIEDVTSLTNDKAYTIKLINTGADILTDALIILR